MVVMGAAALAGLGGFPAAAEGGGLDVVGAAAAAAMAGVGGFPAAADGGCLDVLGAAVAALEVVGAVAVPADGVDFAAAAVLPTGWGSLNPEE